MTIDKKELTHIKEKFKNAHIDAGAFHKKYKLCQDAKSCYCCSTGCYLEPSESEFLVKLVTEKKQQLERLGVNYSKKNIKDGFHNKEKKQMELVPFEYSNFGNEVYHTSCVFRDAKDGFCSLQKLALLEGKHQWQYKPLECWLFPIVLHEENNQITIASTDNNPFKNEEFSGYIKYANCSFEDEVEGIIGYEKFSLELAQLSEILECDLIKEIIVNE